MSKRPFSDVCSGQEEEEDACVADETHDDVVDDVVYDVEDGFRYKEEDYIEWGYYKVDHTDISELDPADGRLFPNITDAYRDTIKLLINPKHCRDEPPLYIDGIDPDRHEKAQYGDKLTTCEVKVGQKLDVVSLLSDSRGLLRVGAAAPDDFVKPETLKGKYVVVVCVFAPARWVECNCRLLCLLRIVSDQLSEAQNFEMVIVPKMRKKCATSKAAFDNFVAAFPGRLFVPFEDDEVRDKVCQRLNFRDSLKAILLDTDHKVAQEDVSDIVANYYYPTRENNTKLKYLSPDWIRPPSTFDELIKTCSSSLAWLLDSSYGDSTLRLHSLSSTETTTVGQLSDKLVGLYLIQGGDKLDSLLEVYDQCRKKGLDFDIVVVCMSFASLDPLVVHDVVIGELQKVISDRPWWVLPYNAATYSTLFELTMGPSYDTMITVGPSRKFFVDVHGGEVVHRYGIQAYPFNREMIVRKYELGAKAITLDSLLCYGDVDYVLRGGKQVPVADLYDKVVVVYTDFKLKCYSNTYKVISKWYKEIRKQNSDFEVVFIPYEEAEDKNNEKHSTAGMDLLVRPYDPEHSSFLRKHESFFMGDDGHGFPLEGLRPDSTLLFGKGGQLCSVNAILYFATYGLDAYRSCGDNNLRDEIMMSLALEFHDFMSGNGLEKFFDVISLD